MTPKPVEYNVPVTAGATLLAGVNAHRKALIIGSPKVADVSVSFTRRPTGFPTGTILRVGTAPTHFNIEDYGEALTLEAWAISSGATENISVLEMTD